MNRWTPYRQSIEYLPFDRGQLAKQLRLAAPPFELSTEAFFQLHYLAAYVSDDRVRQHGLNCKCVVIERHYIDRDYIEDYSIFYSRSLFPYPNHCQRVHFFAASPAETRRELSEIRKESGSRDTELYQQHCRAFSLRAYLGFSVIRPLPGSPVGRTVLRPYPEDVSETHRRDFSPTHYYDVHLHGAELRVAGLPFQQQDKAVSACATTAIWSALHKARALEEAGAATPAQITTLATRNSLYWGRAMPSEGLTVDQMCQAVQSAGASPVLRRTEDFGEARALLHDALVSGISPVAVIRNLERLSEYHAVAVVGGKMRQSSLRTTAGVADRSQRLDAVYVHDDRVGPYVRADIARRSRGLKFTFDFGTMQRPSEKWQLTHILFPLHQKIRLSFGELRAIAYQSVIPDVSFLLSSASSGPVSPVSRTLTLDVLIMRAHTYLKDLALQVTPARMRQVSSRLVLPRYAGVVRVSNSLVGTLDVILDTTSTDKSPSVVAVIAMGNQPGLRADLATELAEEYGCESVA